MTNAKMVPADRLVLIGLGITLAGLLAIAATGFVGLTLVAPGPVVAVRTTYPVTVIMRTIEVHPAAGPVVH